MAARMEGAMLLQCGNGDDAAGESARLSWLRPETLESLIELNELCLTLLAEQAAQQGNSPAPLLREVRSLWPRLDAPARRRAAGCPCLLLDAGFADPERWRGPAAQVSEGARPAAAPFFTVPGTVEVLRLALTWAWHLARTQPPAARLLLGASAASAALIGGCTLRQIHGLAERHAQWLRPRWASRPQMWRGLLLAAGSGEPRQLEEAHMHGLTLLAAETRALTARTPPATVAAPAAARGASAAPRLILPAGTASTAPSPRSPARP